METISAIFATASLVLAVISAIAAFFPKLARADSPAKAFLTYFIPAVLAIVLADLVSPPPPPRGEMEQTPSESNSNLKSKVPSTITSTGNGYACATEEALIKLIEANNAGDQETASKVLSRQCFQTRTGTTIHVQGRTEQSVKYSDAEPEVVSWTTPDNVTTTTK